jgi:hypothetical protein
MPKIDWLKNEFHYGYDSGNILSLFPNNHRRNEEKIIGGNYRKVFNKAIKPYLRKNSKVIELGPGRGAWSTAILKYIPEGMLTTLDFQDVTKWINPEGYYRNLNCIKIENNEFKEIQDDYYDLMWSFGVLCHNNQDSIFYILKNSLSKIKGGGFAIHHYGDWEKLEEFGWIAGGVPSEFRNLSDNDIWWPRNTKTDMTKLAIEAGWKVISADLELLKRDSIILLKKL